MIFSYLFANRLHVFLIFSILIFHGLCNYFWLLSDNSPPSWGDQCGYLLRSLIFYDLVIDGIIENFKKLFFISGHHPPLVLWLPSIFYNFSKSVDIAIHTNIIYFSILLFSVYGIGKEHFNKNVGLLSAFLISLFPMVYGMSRQFLLDFPLAAMVALNLYFLIKTNYFKSRKYSILLGFSLGLGMLTKWSFLCFITAPFFLYVYQSNIKIIHNTFFRFKLKNDRYFNLLLSIGFAGLVSAIWYLPNISNFLHVIRITAPGTEVVPLFGLENTFGFKSIVFYLIGSINHIISFYFAILFIFGCFILKRFYNEKFKLYFIFLFSSYILFTLFFLNKEFRYLLPITPIISVIIASGLLHIKNIFIRYSLVMISVVIGLIQFYGSSFGLDYLPKEVSFNTSLEGPIDRLIFYTEEHRYGYNRYEHSWTGKPNKDDWRIEDILYQINNNPKKRKEIVPKIFVIPHLEKFQIGQFKLFAYNNNIEISLTHNNRDFNTFKKEYLEYDFILTKNRDICLVNGQKNNLIKINYFFLSNCDNFTLIGSFSLPDSSFARLYKNKKI
jgi:hypothetical protein